MRFLLAVLTFLALALSPLAAPAAAARMAAADCEMAGAMAHHDGQATPASGEPCCVAAPADVPVALEVPVVPTLAAIAPTEQSFRILGGAAPPFEGPPPKA